MSKIHAYTFCACLLLLVTVVAIPIQAQHQLVILSVDRDDDFIKKMKLQQQFNNKEACVLYIEKIPLLLRNKGYAAASIDSIKEGKDRTLIQLYAGAQMKQASITIRDADKKWIELSGVNQQMQANKPLNIDALTSNKEKILAYLENNGYPFAAIKLDSMYWKQEQLFAVLNVDKGPLYHIDSISIKGNIKIANQFIQKHLGISAGSIYQKYKLADISKKIQDLPYLQEEQSWSLSMLGTGAVLNLYLQPKKASQVNVLVGLLPNNQQLESNKMLLTGEANINLKNALGNGETIGLNWQQLQVKSPRLNIFFQQPYLFGSAFGMSAAFNLLKKDSSYLNIDAMLGVQYSISAAQTGRVFFQTFKSNLLTVDTQQIRITGRLPEDIDMTTNNLGIDYEWNNTNYRLNPRRGASLQTTISAGTRKIRKNNIITALKDPGFNYEQLYDTVQLNSYQFRIKFAGAKYFPVGKQSAVKIALNGGFIQSPSLYRNELFQIGGYKLLRGFDEESIFASQYIASTLEYRYLLAMNSFLFAFTDLGFTKDKSSYGNSSNQFIGGGLGLSLETKAGIINISLAAGKRNDLKFELRQSKVHIGFISYL